MHATACPLWCPSKLPRPVQAQPNRDILARHLLNPNNEMHGDEMAHTIGLQNLRARSQSTLA
jgi:hypothetical protein